MAQVEQKAECVVRHAIGTVFPGLPGTVGDLTASRGGGHTQAQLLAAVAKLFSGHKFFRLGVQDATPPIKVLNGLEIPGVVPAVPIYFQKQEREAIDVDGAKRVIVKRLLYAV